MGRVSTAPVRTTFGYLFEPKRQAQKDGTVTEKWQITLLFDTNDPKQKEALQECMNDAYQVGVEAFGEHFWTLVQQRSIRWPFRDGAEINPKTGQPRYGAGIIFVNCSSHNKPDVVSRYCDPADPQKKPRIVTDPNEYYWGQYARVNVTFKEFKRQDGNGIACYVNGVQLWHEGEKLGNQFDAQNEFDAEGEPPTASFGGQAPGQQGAPQAPGPAPGAQQPQTPGPGAGFQPPGTGGSNLL